MLARDFNVIPEPRNAARPELWVNDALFLPETRRIPRAHGAWPDRRPARDGTDAGGLYTFWDYQAGGWQKNNGIRIDHLLLSPRQPTGCAPSPSTRTCAAATKPRPHADPRRPRPLAAVASTELTAPRGPSKLVRNPKRSQIWLEPASIRWMPAAAGGADVTDSRRHIG